MISFRVEGPFEIKPLHLHYGRVIQKEVIEKFWEENPECSEGLGCYIFGMRTGGGLIPIYVGKSSTGFRHECFQHHKLTHYNEAIASQKGTPIMFFVVKDSGSNAPALSAAAAASPAAATSSSRATSAPATPWKSSSAATPTWASRPTP
jgi:hypothetical protein